MTFFARLLACGFVLSALVCADINSHTGNVIFDTNSDGNPEMQINSVGTALGTTEPSGNLHIEGNAVFESSFVGIGTTSANSTLEINGSMGLSIETVSSNTSNGNTRLSGNSIIIADTGTAAGNIKLVLSNHVQNNGRTYTIKKTDNNHDVEIIAAIDTGDRLVLSSSGNGLPHASLISDGLQWYIINIDDTAATSVIASDNLVGWWRMNESTGTSTSDSSSNSNTGTLTGGFTFAANSITGAIGRALNFDGSNNYINIPDNAALDMVDQDFTISMWVKVSNSGRNILINKHVDGTNQDGYLLEIGQITAGKVRILISNGSTQTAPEIGDTNWNDGNWHHLLVTFDRSSNATLYRDGQFLASTSISASAGDSSNAQPLIIGHNGNTGYMNGGIDDVRIYSKLLSSEEILRLYQLGQEN